MGGRGGSAFGGGLVFLLMDDKEIRDYSSAKCVFGVCFIALFVQGRPPKQEAEVAASSHPAQQQASLIQTNSTPYLQCLIPFTFRLPPPPEASTSGETLHSS